MKTLDSYNNWHPKALELFELMKTTPQSTVHHQENWVYLHTQMVIHEIDKAYEDGFKTSLKDMQIVGALHDIAKPLTTVFQDGDWRSPGHAKLGEKISREILWKDYPFKERENICSLIRAHGLPIWFQEKENPEESIIAASLRCNLKDLAFFAECDFKGRICNDLEEAIFKIELFREAAENLGCYNEPYKFNDEFSKLHYFKKGGYPGSVLYPSKGATFTLTVGLPGSGKTTWANKEWNGKIVELDEIRKRLKIKPTDKDGQGSIAQAAKEELKQALRRKEDVLWNATNITLQQRTQLIDLALNYDAKIKIVYFDKSIDEIISMNKKREEHKQIPEKKLFKLFRKLEVPTENECHYLEIIS